MASKYYRVTDWRTRLESVGHSVGVVVAAFLLGYLFTYVVAFVLVGLGFVSLEAFTNPDVPLPGWVAIVAFIAQFSGFVAAVVAYLAWRDETDLFEYGVPDLTDLAWGVAGLVGLFVAAFAVSALIQLLGAETATNEVVELGQQNPRLFLYLIPVTILVVAPAEELLFRGVVQGLFRRAYGVAPAVVFASALFGVVHWVALTGGGSQLTYVAVAGVLGLVLGSVYELTENLVVPVAIHALWNVYVFGSQYLVATGAAGA